MTSALIIIGLIFFLLFASAEHQKWGKIEQDNLASIQSNHAIQLKTVQSSLRGQKLTHL